MEHHRQSTRGCIPSVWQCTGIQGNAFFTGNFSFFVKTSPFFFRLQVLISHKSHFSEQVIVDKETGHSRGFGFVNFNSERAMDDAIESLHGKDLDGRPITVNRAKPKGRDGGRGGDRGYSGGGGRGERGGGGAGGGGDCFKCGQPGHWARECPSGGGDRGGGGGHYSSHDRYGSDSARYMTSGFIPDASSIKNMESWGDVGSHVVVSTKFLCLLTAVVEMVEATTAVETMEVVTPIVIAIVEVIAGMEVAMGKKGSQTIVKGMVAIAVVVVTTIPLVGDLLAMKEVPVTDLGLMIAPVVVVAPLMMSEIERI